MRQLLLPHTSVLLVQPRHPWVARESPAGGRPCWISAEVESIYSEPAFLLPCQEFSCRTIKNSESGLRNSWLKTSIKAGKFYLLSDSGKPECK